MLDKAHHLMKVGRYDDAISLYDQILEVNGNNTVALENKGRFIIILAGTKTRLPRMTVQLPSTRTLLPSGSKKDTRCARYTGTRNLFYALSTLLPSTRNIRSPLRTKDIRSTNLGDIPEAIQCFDKILETSPNNIRAMTSKGIALRVVGEGMQKKHSPILKRQSGSTQSTPLSGITRRSPSVISAGRKKPMKRSRVVNFPQRDREAIKKTVK